MIAPSERLCYWLARRLLHSRRLRTADYDNRMFTQPDYGRWRDQGLERQYADNFDLERIRGKDVLDFGCGGGGLSRFLIGQGARSVLGFDLDAERVADARRAVRLSSQDGTIHFVHGTDPATVPFEDRSFDVITVFDVVEHVLDPHAVVSEWHRVLRPGGEILVWWGGGWYAPFAPHIESLVPVPWAHLVLSEQCLINVAARVYDLPDFRPRWWDLDPQTGEKRQNKWRTLTQLPGINRLTIGQFEQLVRRVGFAIAFRNYRGFRGSRFARLTRPLVQFPMTRELFSGTITYRLRREFPSSDTTAGASSASATLRSD